MEVGKSVELTEQGKRIQGLLKELEDCRSNRRLVMRQFDEQAELLDKKNQKIDILLKTIKELVKC